MIRQLAARYLEDGTWLGAGTIRIDEDEALGPAGAKHDAHAVRARVKHPDIGPTLALNILAEPLRDNHADSVIATIEISTAYDG